MENVTKFSNGITPNRSGRLPGAVNKTTAQRTEEFRKKLDETHAMFKLIDYVMGGLESGRLKYSEAIAALSKIAPYYIQTVSMDAIAESIENITTKEQALAVAEQLKATLPYLKAV
jgi:hypothetical protein